MFQFIKETKRFLVFHLHILLKYLGLFFIMPILFFNVNRAILLDKILLALREDEKAVNLLKDLYILEKQENESEEIYQNKIDNLCNSIDMKQNKRDEILQYIPFNSYFFKVSDVYESWLFLDDLEEI